MKLFTKDIDKKLFQQYQNGSDLDSQVVVAKIFNPYGNGRWFLLNSDPQDPDYLWAIVQMGDVVEVGSVLRSELESVRVSPFKFPLERDLGFTMVNAGELYRGLQEGKFYQKGGSLMAAMGMEVGRYYKDKNGDTYRYIGENSQRQTLFNDGQKVIVKSIDDFEEQPKEKKLFGFFEDGGKIDTIPDDYKYIGSTNDYKAKFVNKYDGSILEVDNFEIDPISNRIVNIEPKEALMKYFEKNFADGGFVDKTDEELKGMTDDELFEYLDAKAAYMKQYARPLSSFKAKNYAANSAAIQFQNEGTDKLDANFPSLSKINQQATKDYEETIAKRNKMAMGGEIKVGNKFGDWSITQYKPIVYEEIGGTRGGLVKLVNQNTFDEIFIQYDGALRSPKWFVRNKGVRIEGKNPKEVIEKLKIESLKIGGKVKFQDKVKAIKASLLETKKVPKKVQKDYGKTYNAKEAELAAKRIAGAMAKKGMK